MGGAMGAEPSPASEGSGVGVGRDICCVGKAMGCGVELWDVEWGFPGEPRILKRAGPMSHSWV